MESLLYPLDNEDFAFGLYLPHRVGVEIVKRNLTRCQRAPEGAEQSPTRSCYQIVQRGVVWFHLFRGDAVVLSDFTVHAKENRLFFDGEMSTADFAFHRLHPDLRDVGYVSHVCSSFLLIGR